MKGVKKEVCSNKLIKYNSILPQYIKVKVSQKTAIAILVTSMPSKFLLNGEVCRQKLLKEKTICPLTSDQLNKLGYNHTTD